MTAATAGRQDLSLLQLLVESVLLALLAALAAATAAPPGLLWQQHCDGCNCRQAAGVTAAALQLLTLPSPTLPCSWCSVDHCCCCCWVPHSHTHHIRCPPRAWLCATSLPAGTVRLLQLLLQCPTLYCWRPCCSCCCCSTRCPPRAWLCATSLPAGTRPSSRRHSSRESRRAPPRRGQS